MKIKLEDKIALNDALCQMNDEGRLPWVHFTCYLKLDGMRSSFKRIEHWDEEACKKLTYADLFSENVIADISQEYIEIKENTLVFRKIEETETSKKGKNEQFMLHQVLFQKLKAQIIEDAIDELLNNGGQFNSDFYEYDRNNLKINTRLLTIDNATIENNLFLNELIQELTRFNIFVRGFRDNVTQTRFEINLNMLNRYKIEKFCLNHLR
jgi:carbohydrate-binding DOMON domain-containing protein